MLTFALGVGSTSVFAEGAKKSETKTSADVKETTAEVVRAEPKLKRDMEKLMEAARAGQVAPRQQQFPRTSKSGLSNTAKIAIAASAIGAGIFLAVLFSALSKD